MAVIVRRDIVVDGKTYRNVKIYESDRPIIKDAMLQAEKLDAALHVKMKGIGEELKAKNLLRLKGRKQKPGPLKLWYELGIKIHSLFEPSFSPPIAPADVVYVWDALYDHAESLAAWKKGSRGNRNPFFYCFTIAELPWPLVESADWSTWVTFLDSEKIKDDVQDRKVIVRWLATKEKEISKLKRKRDWLRDLAKAIRAHLENKDISFLTNKLLSSHYEEAYKEVMRVTGNLKGMRKSRKKKPKQKSKEKIKKCELI